MLLQCVGSSFPLPTPIYYSEGLHFGLPIFIYLRRDLQRLPEIANVWDYCFTTSYGTNYGVKRSLSPAHVNIKSLQERLRS